jgi:hypothetical protein
MNNPLKVYIAGPMRGIKDFNFPAFEAAAKALREIGWQVVSPHEEDIRHDGLDVKKHKDFNNPPHSFSYYMKRDLPLVCECDAIALLPGWEQSEGAKLEHQVAQSLGKMVIGDGAMRSVMRSAGFKFNRFNEPGDIAEEPATRSFTRDVAAAPIGAGKTVVFSRKSHPIATGVVDYFPDALMEIARCSHVGNEQHHPGTPLHWDRSKSGDEADALMRHFIQRGMPDTDGIGHTVKVAWRALALLQKELEAAK